MCKRYGFKKLPKINIFKSKVASGDGESIGIAPLTVSGANGEIRSNTVAIGMIISNSGVLIRSSVSGESGDEI